MADLRNVDELPIEIRNQVNSVLALKDSIDSLIAAGPVDADTAYLNEAQTFTKSQHTAPVALTWGANVSIDAELSNIFTLTLTGATAQLDNPTNLVAGMTFMLLVTQDDQGGRALTFDTAYTFGAEVVPNFALSGAGVVDIVSMIVVSPTKISCVATRGF